MRCRHGPARYRTTGNVYDGRNYVQPSRFSQVVPAGADRGDRLQRRRLSQSPKPAQRSHRLVDHGLHVHGRQWREAQDLRRVQGAEARARSKQPAAPPTVRLGPGEGGVRPDFRLDRPWRPARRPVWERVEPATPEELSLGEPQRPPSSDHPPAITVQQTLRARPSGRASPASLRCRRSPTRRDCGRGTSLASPSRPAPRRRPAGARLPSMPASPPGSSLPLALRLAQRAHDERRQHREQGPGLGRVEARHLAETGLGRLAAGRRKRGRGCCPVAGVRRGRGSRRRRRGCCRRGRG